MNIVVVYSGGMDSTVLLYHLAAQGHQIRALSVNYGQRHRKELSAAREICVRLGINHQEVDLSSITPLLSGSALTNAAIDLPAGHYEDQSMRITVVPNRNMILLSLATAWAINERCDAVAYGAHSGDHAIYPDCRETFVTPLAEAIRHCDWHQVSLLRPFIGMTKGDICQLGASLAVPFEKTWSCYGGGMRHCGGCGTCTERREACEHAGVADPTEYEKDYQPHGNFP